MDNELLHRLFEVLNRRPSVSRKWRTWVAHAREIGSRTDPLLPEVLVMLLEAAADDADRAETAYRRHLERFFNPPIFLSPTCNREHVPQVQMDFNSPSMFHWGKYLEDFKRFWRWLTFKSKQ